MGRYSPEAEAGRLSCRKGIQWVPLAPAFTGRGKYTATESDVDGFATIGADAGALTAGYLAIPYGCPLSLPKSPRLRHECVMSAS